MLTSLLALLGPRKRPMVKVKLSVSRAGDNFSQVPGEVVEMDPAEARRHIARGMGMLVEGELPDEDPPEEPRAQAPETADRPAPRTAAVRPTRRKPRP